MKRGLFYYLVFILISSGCSKLILINIEGLDYPSWHTLGGSAARTNHVETELNLPLTLKWQHELKVAIGITLVAADCTIMGATKDGRIFALNMRSGKKIGTLKLPKDDEGSFSCTNGNLFVTLKRSENSTALISLSTGRKVWKASFGPIEGEAAIVGTSAFIASINGQVIHVDLGTGNKRWHYKSAEQIHASPSVFNELVIIGNDVGNILALDFATGALKWDFKTGATIYAAPVISDNMVFIGSTDSTFYALDIARGRKVWQFQCHGKIYCTAATNGKLVVFGTTDHYVYCLNSQTGDLVWQFETGSIVGTSPLLTSQWAIVGSLDKNIYIIDLKTGTSVWQFETRGRIRTNPVVVNGNLFVGCENGDVYCFTTAKSDS